jgi:Lecithin retinol acyltransferase
MRATSNAVRCDSSQCDALLCPSEEPPLATHLVTPRALYSHHGIYVGRRRVIHAKLIL